MRKRTMDQWSGIAEKVLSPNVIATIGIGFFHFSLLVCLLSWHWGQGFTKDFLLPYLSMLGSLAAAFATFVAAVVALGIAKWQDKAQNERQAVACLHHAMAIVNDLRGRVNSMAQQLTRGGWPLVALTLNAEVINRRAETLFDRELYVHLPGQVVDRITAMQGSLFGLRSLVATLDSGLTMEKHRPVPQTPEGAGIATSLAKLEEQLDLMFTDLLTVRQALDAE